MQDIEQIAYHAAPKDYLSQTGQFFAPLLQLGPRDIATRKRIADNMRKTRTKLELDREDPTSLLCALV